MAYYRPLSSLADEYLSQAQVQTRLIEKHRERLNKLQNPVTSREAYQIKALLLVLYSQRRELMETAGYLQHYYDKEVMQCGISR